jgi:rhamnose transport system ATP-binding protein
VVGTKLVGETNQPELIRMMVGRTLDALFPKQVAAIGTPKLQVRDIRHGRNVRGVSFEVRRDEIVGMAGLGGAGRSEMAMVLFGITPAESGSITIDQETVAIRSPQQAMQLGIAYAPEDRKHQGLILPMTVRENTTLAILRRLAHAGFVDRRAERTITNEYVDRLRIRTPGIAQLVRNLSGGNQQKIVIAKWLAREPKVLILDEPTRGIDVGAKAEIHRLMSALAQQGLAIIMISSELPEILGMSDRVLVMRQGQIVAEFARAEATQEAIIEAAMGTKADTRRPGDQEAAIVS